MKILYVYAHPNEKSFNSLIKEFSLNLLQKEAQEIKIANLYTEQFNSIASWKDFSVPANELNNQYFLAQQEAFQKDELSMDIQQQIDNILWADHILFQFPLWWFSMPAILKGWLDRVLVKGFAYDSGKVFQDGLLKGKTASLIVTMQSPESAYQTDGIHEATLDSFLLHITHTLKFVGIQTKGIFPVYGAFNIDEEKYVNIFSELSVFLEKINLR